MYFTKRVIRTIRHIKFFHQVFLTFTFLKQWNESINIFHYLSIKIGGIILGVSSSSTQWTIPKRWVINPPTVWAQTRHGAPTVEQILLTVTRVALIAPEVLRVAQFPRCTPVRKDLRTVCTVVCYLGCRSMSLHCHSLSSYVVRDCW